MRRVSRETLVVFQRNRPASAKTVCPASSWQITIWSAVPTILLATVMPYVPSASRP